MDEPKIESFRQLGNAKPSKSSYKIGDADIDNEIERLVGKLPEGPDSEYYREMLTTVVKFAREKPHPGDIRMFNIAMKEARYANRIFQDYASCKKIAVFGSARTAPTEPPYKAAKAFGKLMAETGFMVITGGGPGIMEAAQAGAGRDDGFALNISLPFEQSANATIQGDRKLINFKYFFTRKLNFVKHSDAISLFPGGFGTMDEGFETITLLQTGKAPIVPVVFVDAPKGNYWKTFVQYLREHLLRDGLVSEEDFYLFKVTDDILEARKEVLDFYYNFHSYRYVGDELVIRMQREIPKHSLVRLEEDFSDIIVSEVGIRTSKALPAEINEPELAHLPRLVLPFDRKSHGRLRQLIDRINLY